MVRCECSFDEAQPRRCGCCSAKNHRLVLVVEKPSNYRPTGFFYRNYCCCGIALDAVMNSPRRIIVLFVMTTLMFITQNVKAQSDHQIGESNMASPYVPIESWVYQALDGLTAAGFIQSSFSDLRPWTRMECARLVEEAEDAIDQEDKPLNVSSLLLLKREFAAELRRRAGDHNREFLIESIDERITGMAGRPLTDGFHFAETMVNDQGRPFSEGANAYSGASIRATAGSFAFRVQGELQHVPLNESYDYSEQAKNAIATADFTPEAAFGPISGFTRGRVLEAYVSFALFHNQFTFGRQSLWWGPARSGATLFSNNAEPFTMLRYDRTQPFELPGFLRWLGPIRAQLLVGRMSGAQFIHANSLTLGTPGVALPNQPYIHGEKFSFKPTENFEFGVSRTVVFAGQGTPLTLHTFVRSLFSASTGNEQSDPGDRRNAVDARYFLPGTHHCADIYFDSFTDDQPFPLAYPTESAWISGLSFHCVSKAPQLTIRAEGLLSPHRSLAFPGFFYFNDHYLSGYTNNRQLLGSWIGREAQGEQFWATWQLSAVSNIDVSVRHVNTPAEFLQGGSLTDVRISAEIALRNDWYLHVEEQSEGWHYPLLDISSQRNAEITLQLSYRPMGGLKP
jgi:hypothetical protein